MTPFAAKMHSGKEFIGFGLSELDLGKLQAGEYVVVDLTSIGVGLWSKDKDGKRSFVQPRNSNVLIMMGDQTEDISKFLNVKLPE